MASGFKVITPKTAVQQQKLQQLPPGHVAMVHRQGRTYYIFPDAAHNQAYVGGPHDSPCLPATPRRTSNCERESRDR